MVGTVKNILKLWSKHFSTISWQTKHHLLLMAMPQFLPSELEIAAYKY